MGKLRVNPLGVQPAVGATIPILREETTRRVKRWRPGNMRLRWFACAMLDAERRLRRIKGYLFFAQFVEALEKEVAKQAERELQAVA